MLLEQGGFFNIGNMLLEQILTYFGFFLFCAIILLIYMRKLKKTSRVVEAKIEKAKEEGLYEPVSLYPEIDVNSCIKSGA